jgi:hypothetical protein
LAETREPGCGSCPHDANHRRHPRQRADTSKVAARTSYGLRARVVTASLINEWRGRALSTNGRPSFEFGTFEIAFARRSLPLVPGGEQKNDPSAKGGSGLGPFRSGLPRRRGTRLSKEFCRLKSSRSRKSEQPLMEPERKSSSRNCLMRDRRPPSMNGACRG